MLGIKTKISGMLNTIVSHSSFQLVLDDSAIMRSQSAVDCAAVFSAVALASAVALFRAGCLVLSNAAISLASANLDLPRGVARTPALVSTNQRSVFIVTAKLSIMNVEY